MKQTRDLWNMPITVEIVAPRVPALIWDRVYDYFRFIDRKFSTYKRASEISLINRGELAPEQYSPEMKEVLQLAERTRRDTLGFFDIREGERLDPLGLVKGWAVFRAAKTLRGEGFSNFYIEAGGDIEASGVNNRDKPWKIGIRNPFNKTEIVKVVYLKDRGIATSGNYERGRHIRNPLNGKWAEGIASVTVIGPNVYEADRFATAAFAMGPRGINFLATCPALAGYMIENNGRAVYTSNFQKYLTEDA